MNLKETLGKVMEYSGYVVVGNIAYKLLEHISKKAGEWATEQVAKEMAKSYKSREEEEKKLDEVISLLKKYIERKENGSSSSNAS
jgi:Ca2+-binding EF-hand superfamily protein